MVSDWELDRKNQICSLQKNSCSSFDMNQYWKHLSELKGYQDSDAKKKHEFIVQ